MALTALATANTTIGPAQYADMAQALAPRFIVDSPTDMNPVYSGGTLSLQSGACLAAGTRIRATGSTSVAIPSVASGSRTYAVVIRIDWSKGAGDAATLVALTGTTVNSSQTPNSASINRIPGVLYDALICTVTRTAGTTSATVADMRVWGGDGGPMRVGAAALASPALLDMRAGSMISTDQNQYTKRKDNDGVWRDVGTPSNPWRFWTPTLRYYGSDIPNGTTGGTPVSLGTNGLYSGRYRVVDGLLSGFIQVVRGPSGSQFGTGMITADLPLPCANWQPDTWSMGHMYTSGGDGKYDWHSEMLVKAGWTRGLIWVNPIANDVRLEPHQNSRTGNAGSGIPFINGGYSNADVYTYNIQYPVG